MEPQKDFLFLKQRPAIPQEHPMGCAVACVAFRCGISYSEALKLFAVKEFAWTRGYYCPEIVAAFANAGLKYDYMKLASSPPADLLQISGTMAFVNRSPQYPAGHFFIRDDQGWMNPWASFPQISNVTADFQDFLPGVIGYLLFEKDGLLP